MKKTVVMSGILALALNLYGGVFEDVASLNKGTDGYIIGHELSDTQKSLMKQKFLPSDNGKIVKFLASDDVVVAVNKTNNKVLAINKRYSKVEQKKVQSLVSEMIYNYDEPTAMAHDKMVYWVFDKQGAKVSEDDIKAWKDSLKVKVDTLPLAEAIKVAKPNKKKVEFDPYVSIKLSSSDPIMTKLTEPKPFDAYVMISSEKLIEETMK